MKTILKIELVVTTVMIFMAIGTVAYHSMEKWNYVDSFYFTGITMTTIGYGDLHPTTPMSKIFTVFFAFSGVGISLFALSVLASTYFEYRESTMTETMTNRLMRRLRNEKSRRRR